MADLNDALRLSETLCARICHDFSGSLGTLGGMLELLRETAGTDAEAVILASDAAMAMQQRLEFLRAAWGAHPAPVSLDGIRRLGAGLPGARRLRLDLEALPPDCEFAPDAGRAVLALLLLAADSLPVGGHIALAGSPRDLILTIGGPKAGWPAGLTDCLRDEAAIRVAFDQPRGLSLPLAILFARRAAMRLSLLLTTGQNAGLPPLRLCTA